MAFGLTTEGFNKKKLSDVQDETFIALEETFGVVDRSPQSTFGQIVGVFSEGTAELWDVAELTYLSQYPASATGVALDNVVDINGLTRKDAVSSQVDIQLEGDEGTLVPGTTTEFSQINTSEVFILNADVTIQKSVAVKTLYSVNSLITGTYTLIIDGDSFIVVTVIPTEAEVLNGLKSAIDTLVPGKFETNVIGTTSLQLEVIAVSDSFNKKINYDVQSIDGKLDLDELWSQGTASSENTGPINVPANSITTIVTPVSGLNSVDNLDIGVAGSDVESDIDLRIRRSQSISASGAATIPAIRARLLEIATVTSVTVVENDDDEFENIGALPGIVSISDGATAMTGVGTLFNSLSPGKFIAVKLPDCANTVAFEINTITDDFNLTVLVAANKDYLSLEIFQTNGRPPHSIEAIVSGNGTTGEDQIIADTIWDSVAGGIKTFGNQGPIIVVDDEGDNQSLFFSRPTNITIFVDAEYDTDPEEIHPSDGKDQITTNITNAINALSPGNDVIRDRLFTEFYKVPGVRDIIKLNIGTSPSPTLSDNIAIADNETALSGIIVVQKL